MPKSNPKERRVVVTGLGVVSSIGIGWQEFWKNLIAGKSGISKITSFDTSQYDRHYAGEVKNFDATQFINKRKIPYLGRASQMAIAATKLALEDAGIEFTKAARDRTSVCIGTTTGEIGLFEKYDDHRFEDKLDDFKNELAQTFPANSLNFNISHEFKFSGRNSVFGTACSSGNYAIGQAFDWIRSGQCDYAVAGGADGISRIVYSGFCRLLAVAPRKCQPFDKDRKGMIPGEGAGVLFLESLESAQKRKANIYAEILGYGLYCDARHMTNPSEAGVSKAIERTLSNSNVKPNEIDYICAHGTATKENDETECKAINRVFGKYINSIPVSSIKSMLGHTMGAASALESIACCLAITKSQVPPTINHKNRDPNCVIDCVANKGRKHNVRIALNNSQAFGGNNACVVFEAV